jgi:hypothetical protein
MYQLGHAPKYGMPQLLAIGSQLMDDTLPKHVSFLSYTKDVLPLCSKAKI